MDIREKAYTTLMRALDIWATKHTGVNGTNGLEYWLLRYLDRCNENDTLKTTLIRLIMPSTATLDQSTNTELKQVSIVIEDKSKVANRVKAMADDTKKGKLT